MDQTTLPPPEHFLQLCPVPEKHLILHLFHRVEQLATNFKLLEVYTVISKKSRAMASYFLSYKCGYPTTVTIVTSKTSVELGGIVGGWPAAPYASAAGMIMIRVPPRFIPASPSSIPLITCPCPIATVTG